MIRVVKPNAPPEILRRRGPVEAQRLKDAYDSAPAEHVSGAKSLEIKAGLYGHPSVVQALRLAQHNKCCFCERRSLGDVEHFRPKSGHQQSPADPLEQPGYYWLAYEWRNLFYACGPCNQRFKRNLFPLRDPAQRALSHHHDIAREEPLLLDPADDDPTEHLGFREEIAYAKGDSLRGKTTIELLQLNREELRESRFDQYRRLKVLKDSLWALQSCAQEMQARGTTLPNDLRDNIASVQSVLQEAVSDTAEYSAMARGVVP